MASREVDSRTSSTVKDVPAAHFIQAYAAWLKKSGQITLPKWHDIVKTATYKELPPLNPDWYFIRAAAIARQIYIKGRKGIGALRKTFGGRKIRGTQPSHHGLGAGGIIRSCLKVLHKKQIIQNDKTRGGRRLTDTGRRSMDRIAARVMSRNIRLVKAARKAAEETEKAVIAAKIKAEADELRRIEEEAAKAAAAETDKKGKGDKGKGDKNKSKAAPKSAPKIAPKAAPKKAEASKA
eukprot:TRINITY_DN168_c1_g2_i1.p1 TRINITY_DN168_c1_g2~~TRINITY_DN168_c1_g2_i1.p1  ORF type:complete len:237 (+),score=144.90 TRINITY_DN168_c1_g2_i1:237-947(+)